MKISVWTLARAVGWLTACCLLVAAGAYYRAGRPAGDLHAAAVRAAAQRDAADRTSPSTGTRPGPVRPSTGPGVDAPGTLVAARYVDGDLIDVSETIRARTTISSLWIEPPRARGVQPRLVGGQLSADGRVVLVPVSVVAGRVRIDLPTPARVVVFRYQLAGSILRSKPSKPGRAAIRFAPAVDPGDRTPVVFAFGGPEIINVSCPELPLDRLACARGTAGGLTLDAPVARDDALVLLQLDLPGI